MLKHCQTVAVEARAPPEPLGISLPPLLPPQFELCTDTISLSSGSGSSSPTLSYIREMSLDLERKKSSLATPFASLASLSPISLLPTSWKFSPVSNKSSLSDSSSVRVGLQRSKSNSLFSPIKTETEKDQKSPVLVQCRWFDSPALERKEKFESKNADTCDPRMEDDSHVYATVVEVMQGEYVEKQEEPVTEQKQTNMSIECPTSPLHRYSESRPEHHLKNVTCENKPRAVKKREVFNDQSITIKVYAKCLGKDIEYKTVVVGETMTSRELVWLLLTKCRMKQKDPKLYYLTMDVTVKKTGIPLKRTLVLDDDSRPAQLRSCNPWGECKFSLQMRKGGLVRVYDSVLVEELKYKCLCISEETTVEDVISMLLNCYGIEDTEEVSRFCIYETGTDVERKCNQTEKPLQLQSYWTNSSPYHKFVLRRSTRSVSNQFPEETCVDESDRLLWGYASHDSSSSTCSEIENAFYPSPAGLDSSSEISIREQFLAPVFSPTLPQVAFSTFGARNTQDIVQKSAFLPMIRPVPSRGSFYPRVIKKSSFGSVTSATASEESDNFFYI